MHRSAEYQLLLLCARTAPEPQHLDAAAELLRGRLDWDRVLHLASWHRLSPLLYRNLAAPGLAGRAPPEAVETLEGDYFAAAAQNLLFQAELGRILEALRADGIPTIVLKGAALAELVYPDAALRPMVDLDIMVPGEQARRAEEAVLALGYVSTGGEGARGAPWDQHRHRPPLLSADGMVPVEVHRHILEPGNPLYFDLEGFWARARPARIAGAPALVMGPEDMLTHLCVNFLLDRKYRSRGALGQLCDIAETLRRYEGALDWGLFAAESTRRGVARAVSCALLTTTALLDASPPRDALAGLARGAPMGVMVERFIEMRVLRAAPWLGLELVRPRKRPWRRLFPGRAYVERVSPGSKAWAAWVGVYGQRILGAMQLVGRWALRPWEPWQDLRLNRWLYLG